MPAQRPDESVSHCGTPARGAAARLPCAKAGQLLAHIHASLQKMQVSSKQAYKLGIRLLLAAG